MTEPGGKRGVWRKKREEGYRAEQAALVDENDIAIATKLVKYVCCFMKHDQLYTLGRMTLLRLLFSPFVFPDSIPLILAPSLPHVCSSH